VWLYGMKALVLERQGVIRVEDVERPSPARGELLVRMRACGVCGTDLEKVRGEAVTPPVLGHEVVGEVAEVSEGVEGFSVGERVFVHHHAPCYSCELCARGEYTMCPEFPKHNIRPGGFSEYFVVPEWNVKRGAVTMLPEGLDFEEASFIEPLGCCIRGLGKVGNGPFHSALVYGAGPVGLIFLKLLIGDGCRVALTDVSEYRLDFARRLGASAAFHAGDVVAKREALEAVGRPELVVLATGSPNAFNDALATVERGGSVLLFGAPPRGSTAEVDLASFFIRGARLVASYSTSEKETLRAVEMLGSGSLRLSDLITHRFSLEESPEAFRVAGEQRCIKAVVNA
jgi:L-iditol 2-dehydrogenase